MVLALLCAVLAAATNTGAMAADRADDFHGLNEIIRSLAPIEYLPEHGGAAPSIDLDVRFALDSATLTTAARHQLDELAAAMKWPGLLGARFLLVGHTDATGTRAHNLALSERRAAAARSYLVSRHGIAPARLEVLGWGEERLRRPNDPASGLNRRVEVVRLAPLGHAETVDRDGLSVGTSPLDSADTTGNRREIEW
jgi:outer membrane protein OmpA-like peptidoglycan-associated protein